MTVKLHRGDCVRFMREYRGAKFDAVMADPPYEDEMHNAKSPRKKKLRNDGHKDQQHLDFKSITGIRGKVTPLISDLCDGWALIFCTPEGVAPWRDAIEDVRPRKVMKYKRACVWVKPDACPQFNGQGPAMGVEMIVTAWCGKGYSSWNGGGRAGVFTHGRVASESGPYLVGKRKIKHPTVKPLSLMMELIELFTDVGDTVFDPFMGSGSTGVACVRLGRNFVGVEKDPRYFAIAQQRIAAATRQPDFFHDTPLLNAKCSLLPLNLPTQRKIA